MSSFSLTPGSVLPGLAPPPEAQARGQAALSVPVEGEAQPGPDEDAPPPGPDPDPDPDEGCDPLLAAAFVLGMWGGHLLAVVLLTAILRLYSPIATSVPVTFGFSLIVTGISLNVVLSMVGEKRERIYRCFRACFPSARRLQTPFDLLAWAFVLWVLWEAGGKSLVGVYGSAVDLVFELVPAGIEAAVAWALLFVYRQLLGGVLGFRTTWKPAQPKSLDPPSRPR